MKRSHGYGRARMTKSTSLDGGFDQDAMKKEADDSAADYDKLHELGQKFESDKAAIEKAIDQVENSAMSSADKKQTLLRLRSELEQLQKEYDAQVTEAEKELEKDIRDQIDDFKEAADEAQEQADSLNDVELDTGSADLSAAADAARAQKEAYEKLREENVQRLELKIQQAEIQKRNMRSRRLSGR